MPDELVYFVGCCTWLSQKYTKWADKAKGINPFVPSKPRLPRSLTGKIGMTLLYAPIVLPRLLLFSAFVTIAVLGRILITPVGVVVVAAAVTKDISLTAASVVLGTLMVTTLFCVLQLASQTRHNF